MQHCCQSRLSETQFLHFPAEFEFFDVSTLPSGSCPHPFMWCPAALSSVSSFPASLADAPLPRMLHRPLPPNPPLAPTCLPLLFTSFYIITFILTGYPASPAPAGGSLTCPGSLCGCVYLLLPRGCLPVCRSFYTYLSVSWLVCALRS